MGRRRGFVIGTAALVPMLMVGLSGGSPTGAAAPPTAPVRVSALGAPTSAGDESSSGRVEVGEQAAEATKPAVRLNPPPADPPPPPGSEHCPATGHAAIVDRNAQRGWLCTDGLADAKFPVTTAWEQPRPGQYKVYAKDRLTTSNFGGHFSYLDNFVAFTRGIYSGARIAFHAVPRTAGGAPFQPYDKVGTQEWRGDSAGCIRVLPAQSVIIWNHLRVGDSVIVIS